MNTISLIPGITVTAAARINSAGPIRGSHARSRERLMVAFTPLYRLLGHLRDQAYIIAATG